MAFMSLPLRQLHLRAHLHGLPHRHVLPHHVRFSFLFNFCSMCLQKSLLFPKVPLWHEIIPNAESNNIFCDLSKLRSNFEGDDANPFLWDTPTPLYMQHKHIVTRYTRFSKYQFRLEGIPTTMRKANAIACQNSLHLMIVVASGVIIFSKYSYFVDRSPSDFKRWIWYANNH